MITLMDAVQSLRPNSECTIENDGSVTWQDAVQTAPTTAELTAEVARLKAKRVIMDKIETLETEVTPRRLRDSVLTTDGKTWLTNKEAEVAEERSKL